MALFKDWQDFADKKSAEPGAEQYWTQYFLREKDFYEKLLKGEAPKSGTVQALADHFGVDIIEMTGYLDGINESLKAENDLENMTAETEVSLDYEPEKLYYNMVGAKAEWLYKLPQWDSILTEEKRKGALQGTEVFHHDRKGSEGRPQRSVPLRQRQKVQEVLRQIS